jgi:fructose-1-phosphate kinase PfkB-like protein
MAKQTGEQIVQDSTTEALARSGEAANEMIKGNVDALAETGNASRAAVQELTKAYQELTTKNVRELDCRDAGTGRSEKRGRIY